MRRLSEAIMILALLVLTSCEKDEIPVAYEAPTLSEGSFSSQVSMGSDYRYRLYYDIESDSVVAKHVKADWDLSFSCDGLGHIRLNDSRLMMAWKVTDKTIEEVQWIQGEGPLYDESSGLSRALDGAQPEEVYVIELGFDADGTAMGRYKIQVLDKSDESYTLRYAVLNSEEINEVTIPIDESRGQVHFSFTEGVKLLEPPKEDWDLLFTHYTFYFEEEEIPYLVSGALINPYMVGAQDLDIYDFESIDAAYLDGISLSTEQDVIGYDWKYFDLDSGIYSLLDNAYVIYTAEGNRYKLQFTGFTDALGERGAPSFRAALIP